MNKTISCIQCGKVEPIKALKSKFEGQLDLKESFVNKLFPKVLCQGCCNSAKIVKMLDFMVKNFLNSLNHTCQFLFSDYNWK